MKELFICFLFVIMFFGSIMLTARYFDKIGCENYQENTNRETNYKVFTCYIKYNNSWYTSDEFNAAVIEQAK